MTTTLCHRRYRVTLYLTADTFVVWQRVDNYRGLDSTSHTIITFQQPRGFSYCRSGLCGNLPVQFYNTSVGTLGAILGFWRCI
ncbi:MAG: hypothetical protein IPP29_16760 [Bacteroidetes bacterium]|nr:hypothetical protein [Bacteroidota bacterium]